MRLRYGNSLDKLIGPTLKASLGPVWRMLGGYFAHSLLWNACFKRAAISANVPRQLALVLGKSPSVGDDVELTQLPRVF